MKKILLTTLAIAAALVPAQAQLNGNGYYRIKNKSTGQYATLASDEMSYQKAIDGVGGSNLLGGFGWRIIIYDDDAKEPK